MAARSHLCEQFARNLARLLRESGMSRERFARRAGISRGRLANALDGRDVYLSCVDACARGFEVSRCRLLMQESERLAVVRVLPGSQVPSTAALAIQLRRWVRSRGGALRVAAEFGLESSLVYRVQGGRNQVRLSTLGVFADAMERRSWTLVEPPAHPPRA